MQIKLSPLLKKDPKFEIDQRKFHEMLRQKKTAQRYDAEGKKYYNIKDNTVRYKKAAAVALKHDYMQGPFLMTIFKTGSEWGSAARYDYQGYILVEENEIARVYRDSLLDGYIDAYFTDDSTLLMDVRNKITKDKYAVQIDGEPTLAYCGKEDVPSCFNFEGNFTGTNEKNLIPDESNDDENHTNEKMIQDHTNKLADSLGIARENCYAVIQLDC